MKKRLFTLALALVLVLGLLPLPARAAGVIAVDETNFPDANFRAYILERSYGADGILTQAELAEVTEITVRIRGIQDLTGIEYFTALTSLSCNNNQLTDLDVSRNTALTSLSCNNNQLTDLDLSSNTALTWLDCANNQLTGLDVCSNTALTYLNCGGNQLTSLDVSKNAALEKLYCYNNPLAGLDLSQNAALTMLDCGSNNQLTSLDVSSNTALEYLSCKGSQLTSLDVSKNTALTELWCTNNQLTSLDVSKNTALIKLGCGRNQLTSLDVSRNTALTELECDENQLTSLDLSKNTALTYLKCTSNQLTGLDLSQNTALEKLYCSGNQLTSLDLSRNTALTWMECRFNQLTSLDLSQHAALTHLECNDNKLTGLDVRQSTKLTKLYCQGNQLTSLDVSGNTALTELSCINNQLTSLDLSQNAALTDLACSYNQLTSLDLSQNTKLTELTCDGNQLTSLDMSSNTALTYLGCDSNQLTSLDLSQNTKLTSLYCRSNQLTSLDVSSNTALTELMCNKNSYSVEPDANNQFDLSTLPGAFDVARASDWAGGSVNGNILTFDSGSTQVTYTYQMGEDWTETFTLTVAEPAAPECGHSQTETKNAKDATCTEAGYTGDTVCTACGTTVKQGETVPAKGHTEVVDKAVEATCTESGLTEGKHCAVCEAVLVEQEEIPAKGHSYETGKCTACGAKDPDYVEPTEGIAVDETNFPDANFRAYILEKTYGADGILTQAELAEVTDIYVSRSGIQDLTGIEYFTALECLYCDNNDLTSLDVSGNTALESLACVGNQLTGLDVSNNTALMQLSCGGNQLTGLDVSSNTALTYLNCASNQLTSLDVSNNTALTSLYCFGNDLTSLDVSSNTALKYLECDNNQLTSLDVSRNTALTQLMCGKNSDSIEVDANNQFDLSKLLGAFDVARASDWKGGTVSGGILTVDSGSTQVTYTYQMGENWTETFTLTVAEPECGHSQTETKNAKDATCTEAGYTGDTVCTACGATVKQGETVSAKGHTEVVDKAVEATCTESGLTEGKHCAVCEAVLAEQEEIPALGHSYETGKCTACGGADPDYVEPTEPEVTEPETTEPEATEPERLAGADRVKTAFLVADRMKENLGVEKFDSVIVANGWNFADALGGSYLAAVKEAPILLCYTTDKINDQVKDYITENLNPGGTVYLLGGENAVPASIENGLEQFTIDRLAGSDRFGTNLAILEEAGVGDKPILVCTGLSFADSLSASATEMPILLVWKELTDDQKAFLAESGCGEFYIIGGESAVSEGMMEQVSAYGTVERVAGGNRFETSVAIAEKFFRQPKSAVLAYAGNFPDGLCGGPLAVTMDAPLILTMDHYETGAAEYIRSQSIKTASILGGETLISDETVNNIFQ